jgi:hypothetical protein
MSIRLSEIRSHEGSQARAWEELAYQLRPSVGSPPRGGSLSPDRLVASGVNTALVVAHRLTQAAGGDRIVVLDHGVVVESGTRTELVAVQGRYAELWRAWDSRASG